ncbi:hypothetical protein Pla175_04330 [Pirellulimonas nuda]|uniref:HEAT repeat protein n=1 Tax=Pirellulimonas nuda TaxID=2528009 RepID=A0A518D6G4_9BACT|nr:HEAT repeat domain-containing protein [Pirellulimonas nuda]QDU87078.1 hypothetical protein Pla175_04330 [Pirellulimonas nuda]
MLRTLILIACTSVAPLASAIDVVQLATGGRVVGTIVPNDDRNTVAIDLEGGGRLTLTRKQIALVTPRSAAQQVYAGRAPTVPDTPLAQWNFAEWCRENGLADESRVHLERVVQLDPNHEEARAQLGYRRVGDRWLDREDLMAARGMVRHSGDYRTPQEIELIERKEQQERTAAEWKNRLARWRKQLGDRDPKRVAEAVQQFKDLKDPDAGLALAGLLAEERNNSTRLLLISAAANVPSPASLNALAAIALDNPDPETRYRAIEALAASRHAGLATPFIKALRSNDNGQVNRGAEAIEALAGPSAVSPLIDALTTKHVSVVGANSGGDTYSMSPTAGVTSFGGGGPKRLEKQLKNPAVLRALSKITGENFGYDEVAWRRWLASRAKTEQVDLRRDG